MDTSGSKPQHFGDVHLPGLEAETFAVDAVWLGDAFSLVVENTVSCARHEGRYVGLNSSNARHEGRYVGLWLMKPRRTGSGWFMRRFSQANIEAMGAQFPLSEVYRGLLSAIRKEHPEALKLEAGYAQVIAGEAGSEGKVVSKF